MSTETDLKKLAMQVEKIFKEIAARRDKLRDLQERIDDVCESIDGAEYSIESGKRDFDRAIDSLSQFL